MSLAADIIVWCETHGCLWTIEHHDEFFMRKGYPFLWDMCLVGIR